MSKAWFKDRVTAQLDNVIGVLVVSGLAALVVFISLLATKLSAFQMPAAWTQFLVGAFAAFLFVALGAATIAWIRRVRRPRAPRPAGFIYVPKKLLDDIERRMDDGDFTIKTHQPDRDSANLGKVIWREADVDEALERGDVRLSPSELAEAHRRVTQERDEAISRCRDSESGRESAISAFETVKQSFALARLRWMSDRSVQNQWNVQATIRFADYADFKLVQQIESILKTNTAWTVAIDGSNKPTLRPHDEFKVVFESGLDGRFSDVANLFDDGRLISVNIAVRTSLREDLSNLVVEVLPTPNPPSQ